MWKIRDWFVDNKLNIHFGEDKTKCMLFDTKKRLKKDSTLDISPAWKVSIFGVILVRIFPHSNTFYAVQIWCSTY